MSLILLIETATTVCSVALAEGEDILAYKEADQRNIHAEAITVFIDELFKITGKNYNDIDAVAVSCGPGSYTGLRIGVSTAKGLCYALDKPLIAIETLEAMTAGIVIAAGQLKNNALLCPMIDARRMEVFTAMFDTAGKRIRPTSAEILDENSFSNLLQTNQMIFFGDGAWKCKEILGNNPNVQIVTDFTNSARHLAKIAGEKFDKKEFEDVAYFEPYYLKDFIAGKKAL